jgi:hypothetical protein
VDSILEQLSAVHNFICSNNRAKVSLSYWRENVHGSDINTIKSLFYYDDHLAQIPLSFFLAANNTSQFTVL